MGVLDRYLLRELISPFFLGTALFTFFLVIGRIYDLTDLVITKGVPLYLVVQLLAFMLPSFLAYTLPMALLVAVLLAGGRLASDLEIVAFKAAGVSIVRLFRPVLLAVIAVSLVTGALTLAINPLANRAFQRQLFKILQSRAVTAVQERIFNNAFGDVVVYVEEVSPSQVALRGVLLSDERDPKLSRIIIAREARLLSDEEHRRITLRLLSGAVHEADVVRADPPRTSPTQPISTGGAAGAARYRSTHFSVYDMNLSLDSPLRDATRFEKVEYTLTLPQLEARIAELRRDRAASAPFRVEWHKRFALPVAALVFALVGFPLAVRSHRSGRSIAIVGSLVIFLSYYFTLTWLEGMALRQWLPIGLAIWMPNLLFVLAGLGLLTMTRREWRWPRLRALLVRGAALGRRLPRPRRIGLARAGILARESTHIIDRYLIREFLGFAVIGLAVTAALFIVGDLFSTIDRFMRLKPPLIYILQHFAYRMPAALLQGLPVIVLVATIFLYLTLSRYHELTALKAAGVSLYRVSAPVLLLGLAIACAAGLFQELALPRINELAETVDRVKIKGELPRHLQSRQRLWLRSSDTRFFRVELLNPATNDLYGVTVLELDGTFRLFNRLDARRAHWTPEGWVLTEGAFREIGTDGKVQTVPFTRTALVLPERIDDFTEAQRPVTAMSFLELRDYVIRLEAAGFRIKKYLVDLYSKLALPLANLVMVLVAIPFALQAPRGGRLFGAALAIAILAAYLVVHYVALAFARADLLPPLLAAWTANVIFLGLGVSFFLRART